jgi:hypothetical protein
MAGTYSRIHRALETACEETNRSVHKTCVMLGKVRVISTQHLLVLFLCGVAVEEKHLLMLASALWHPLAFCQSMGAGN